MQDNLHVMRQNDLKLLGFQWITDRITYFGSQHQLFNLFNISFLT